MKHPTQLALAATALYLGSSFAAAQLRVVDYNIGGATRSGLDRVLKAIGDESRNGIQRPLDVISLQEVNASSTQAVVDLLNSIYGPGTYARSTVFGGGDTTQSIVYRTSSVQLVGQKAFGTTGSTAAARQTLRFQLRPAGYGSEADFYLYSSHYKAGDSGTDASRRWAEAIQTRADADALGSTARIIYTGDFNTYGNNEPSWTTLTSPGNGQAYDPINRIGLWNSNSSYKDIHTQSPVVNASQHYSGQVGGGMDDRFDFQIVTDDVLSGRGFSYISGSYHAFGNTGTHVYNGNITTGSSSALIANLPGYTLAQGTSLLTDIESVADHLPVVADYRIPAKAAASIGAAPALVIVDAGVSIPVSISNAAPVTVAAGADTLDYTLTGTGISTINLSGSASPIAPAVAYNVPLNTSNIGLLAGSISVKATSPGSPSTPITQAFSVIVVDHANASFSPSSDVNTLHVDLGSLALGSNPVSETLVLYNMLGTLPTAPLDIAGVTEQGDAASLFSLTLDPTTGITTGSGVTFELLFDPATLGAFTVTYTIFNTDTLTIPGALPGVPLVLTVHGVVIPEPSSLMFLAGFPCLLIRSRRVK